MQRILFAGLTALAVLLSGCTDEPTTDDAEVPEVTTPEVETTLEPAVYSGTTLRAALFCEEAAKPFTEDHAGWSYELDSAGTVTGDEGYVVWEQADGAREPASDPKSGKVPANAAAVVVCLDLTSQGMTMDWEVTITPPTEVEAEDSEEEHEDHQD